MPVSRKFRRIASPPPSIIVEGEPTVTIAFYRNLTVLTRKIGGMATSYPVADADVARALSIETSSFEVLPPNTVATGTYQARHWYLVLRPAGVATLRIAFAEELRELVVPLPPLLWLGCGTRYHCAALATTAWPTMQTPLMLPPLPNVFVHGGICWGSSSPRPVANSATMGAALHEFLNSSYFTPHIVGGRSKQFGSNILAQLEALHEAKAESYPLDDLQPSNIALGDWVSRELGASDV